MWPFSCFLPRLFAYDPNLGLCNRFSSGNIRPNPYSLLDFILSCPLPWPSMDTIKAILVSWLEFTSLPDVHLLVCSAVDRFD